MRIFNLKKFIVVSFVLFFLVNCVQDEMKEYVDTVTWKDVNLEVLVKTKYFENKINFLIRVEDIDGGSIFDADYYEKLIKEDIGINFMDKDSFLIFEETINIVDFNGSQKDGKAYALFTQKSRKIEKRLYSKIAKVRIIY